jgi:hypothetical protein
MAVHCWAGIGRLSLIAAALLVRLGTSADQAWDAIAKARGRAVPETGLDKFRTATSGTDHPLSLFFNLDV